MSPLNMNLVLKDRTDTWTRVYLPSCKSPSEAWFCFTGKIRLEIAFASHIAYPLDAILIQQDKDDFSHFFEGTFYYPPSIFTVYKYIRTLYTCKHNLIRCIFTYKTCYQNCTVTRSLTLHSFSKWSGIYYKMK